MERIIEKGELLIVRGEVEAGLCQRGRTMISPFRQVVQFKHPNRFYNLRLEHIAGPLSGVQIHFAIAFARKARRKPICGCAAYSWPHIKGKGDCNE